MWELVELVELVSKGAAVAGGGGAAAAAAASTPLDQCRRSRRIWLKPGVNVNVGRGADCTLVINNKKVSRLHATITVAPASPQDVANPLSVSAVTLTDSKSSFGTFVQGTRIAHSVPFTLLDGNIINFGNLATMSFKLVHHPIVLFASGIVKKDRDLLIELASALDFKLVKDWSPACTHLFMREIRVNLKVLFALVTLAPIVGWKWIDALKLMEIDHFSLPLVNVTSSEDEESVQGGEAVPLSSYLPRVDVSDLTLATALDNGQVSFLCNPNRRAIFANRHFVFFTEKQHQNLEALLTLSGAKVHLRLVQSNESIASLERYFRRLAADYAEGGGDSSAAAAASALFCVVRPSGSDDESVGDGGGDHVELMVEAALKSTNRRPIDENDIAMTILTLNESFIDPYQESQQPTPFPSTAAAPLPASSYHQNMVDDSQNMDFVVDISSAASSSAINKDNAAVKAAAAAATTELEKDLPSSSSSALQKQKHQHSNIATTTTAAAVLDDEVELPSSQPPQPHRTQKSSARILASLPKPTSALGDFFDSLIDSVPTYTNTNTSAAVVATTFTPGANKPSSASSRIVRGKASAELSTASSSSSISSNNIASSITSTTAKSNTKSASSLAALLGVKLPESQSSAIHDDDEIIMMGKVGETKSPQPTTTALRTNSNNSSGESGTKRTIDAFAAAVDKNSSSKKQRIASSDEVIVTAAAASSSSSSSSSSVASPASSKGKGKGKATVADSMPPPPPLSSSTRNLLSRSSSSSSLLTNTSSPKKVSPEKKASSSKASTRPQAYTTAAMKKIAAKMKGDGDIGFKSEDSDQGSDQEEEVGDEEDDGNGEGASSSNAALKSAAIVEFADLVVTAPRGSGTGGGGGWKGGKASASTNAKLCSGLRNVKVFKKSVALYDRPVSSPKRPDLVVDSTGEALLVPRGTLDTFLMKHPKHQQSSTSTTSTSTSKLPAFKTRSTTVSSTAAKKGRMTKQAKSKFDVAENEEMLDWEQEDRYSSDEYDNHDGFGGRDGDNDDEELGEDDDAVARAKRKGKQVASFSSSNNNNS